jgi:hypothetical protein
VNVDLSPPNRSTQVGSVEACKKVNENGILDADEDVVDGVYVDLVLPAPGVPPGYNLQAFNTRIDYNALHVRVAAREYDHLLSANGTAYWGLAGDVPDSDGSFWLFVQDYSPNYENGEGILTRMTLESVSTAPGLATAEIGVLALTGSSAPQLSPGTLGSAMIATNADCGDPDGDSDSVPDWADNCPTAANPGQQNVVHPTTTTGDACEDPEPDGIVDASDNCPGVANATQTDSDSDTLGDPCDNCPAITNQNQANQDGDEYGDACEVPNCVTIANHWTVPNSGDTDCDGYADTTVFAPRASEQTIGTVPTQKCAATGTFNDEPAPDAWPPDFNDNQLVNGSDVLSFNNAFAKHTTDPPIVLLGTSTPITRFDLNGNGLVNGADVLQLNQFFSKRCAP